MEKENITWLSRRLAEIGKSKRQLALLIDVNPTRINEYEKGMWKFQASHLKKVAEFLQFDRTAFLDFISGDISEEELWQAKPEPKISEEDLALLRAVKSIATRETPTETLKNPTQSAEIPTKNKGRE